MGTIIELTNDEATSFLLWRQHQAEFMLLVESQVFEIKNGSAEIHFDREGDIQSIDLHAKVFRRVKAPSTTVVAIKTKL